MNSQALEFSDSQIRQQRYRKALEGTHLSDIPESIADQFIQGDLGCQEVMLAHAQVTRFIAELFCGGGEPVNMEVKGVAMGAFWMTNWLIESQTRLADFEAVRAQMQKESSE